MKGNAVVVVVVHWNRVDGNDDDEGDDVLNDVEFEENEELIDMFHAVWMKEK